MSVEGGTLFLPSLNIQFFSHDKIGMEVAKQLREINKEDAKKNYQELINLPCPAPPSQSRVGLQTLDYFFLHHRLKAKTKRHISFMDALKNSEKLEYIDEKIKKIKGVFPSSLTDQELLQQRYSVFQLYYGTINQFRPSEAKRLYCIFKPKLGILDFSAGWGGRCLAAMACEIPYTGIDANTNLKSSYEKMIEFCKPIAPTKMIYKPSETVDFSKIQYDLVFTSPPYFMLEEYEKMPQYGSKDGFIEKFFRPVVQSAWKHLHTGGYMALNMPKEMYDSVKADLPPLWKRMRLPIMDRHATNAAKGSSIGTHDKNNRSEGIYVWHKQSKRNTTRRVSR